MEKKEKSEINELRKFGISFSVFFILISAVIMWKHAWKITLSIYILLGMSLVFILLALIIPKLLKPIFAGWMKFARGMAWLNTKILLTLLYYIFFTPISIILWIARADLLKQKIRKSEESFWVNHENKEKNISNYEKQF